MLLTVEAVKQIEEDLGFKIRHLQFVDVVQEQMIGSRFGCRSEPKVETQLHVGNRSPNKSRTEYPKTTWKTVYVRTRKSPGEKTKNGLSHRVPLTAPALTIIREMKAVVSNDGYSNYVFQSPKGDTHIRNPQKVLKRIQETIKTDFVGHDFWRTASSMMTGMEIPRPTVKKILNHVEREITAVYDRHSYDREKREALEVWAKRLMLIVSGGAGTQKPSAEAKNYSNS